MNCLVIQVSQSDEFCGLWQVADSWVIHFAIVPQPILSAYSLQFLLHCSRNFIIQGMCSSLISSHSWTSGGVYYNLLLMKYILADIRLLSLLLLTAQGPLLQDNVSLSNIMSMHVLECLEANDSWSDVLFLIFLQNLRLYTFSTFLHCMIYPKQSGTLFCFRMLHKFLSYS